MLRLFFRTKKEKESDISTSNNQGNHEKISQRKREKSTKWENYIWEDTSDEYRKDIRHSKYHPTSGSEWGTDIRGRCSEKSIESRFHILDWSDTSKKCDDSSNSKEKYDQTKESNDRENFWWYISHDSEYTLDIDKCHMWTRSRENRAFPCLSIARVLCDKVGSWSIRELYRIKWKVEKWTKPFSHRFTNTRNRESYLTPWEEKGYPIPYIDTQTAWKLIIDRYFSL